MSIKKEIYKMSLIINISSKNLFKYDSDGSNRYEIYLFPFFFMIKSAIYFYDIEKEFCLPAIHYSDDFSLRRLIKRCFFPCILAIKKSTFSQLNCFSFFFSEKSLPSPLQEKFLQFKERII